jgi:hypothetical protein
MGWYHLHFHFYKEQAFHYYSISIYSDFHFFEYKDTRGYQPFTQYYSALACYCVYCLYCHGLNFHTKALYLLSYYFRCTCYFCTFCLVIYEDHLLCMHHLCYVMDYWQNGVFLHTLPLRHFCLYCIIHLDFSIVTVVEVSF